MSDWLSNKLKWMSFVATSMAVCIYFGQATLFCVVDVNVI